MAISRRSFLVGAGSGAAGVAIGAGLGIGAMSGSGWRINSSVPRAMPVQTLSELPAEADVVVIGAGIAGISTALFLNEKGLSTVVLEKGVVAGEQSSRAFGWVYSNGWDLGKLELTNQSKTIWQSFSERFGEDIGYRQSGNFTLIGSDDEVEMHREWLKAALEIQPQMDSRVVMGSELDALIPGASEKFPAALYQPSDGTAEPDYSVSRIAQGAIREGVKIVAPCAARSIEREAGKIAGVHTEKGYIKARYVVIAGGAWSSLFAGNMGVRVPQLTLSSSMQRLSRIDGALPGAGYGPDFTWRMQANGETSVGVGTSASPITKDSFRFLFDFWPTLGYSGDLVKVRLSKDFFESLRMKSSWSPDEVTPFEEVRMLSGAVDRYENDTALANLRRAFPQFEKAVVKEEWAGIIDATPDSTQFVTDIPDVPGLFLITGFSGNGLTTGPASGQMIAEMIAGEETTCDPSIYRFNRFTDGSEFVFRY
ncbi:NAD(P)/FAD-dependent oxidoreductase [Aquamicrobium zhengzhouense]|uniref:FAD-binding oxidoreductase n=1 Tax=Aquamicrobium zhengzhouense TaxID=2781738 RepID=A0ABS0SHI6_9HYPH|nr:FAD-binding oxidoreductase [Aquamicrobium zhengzhouense]MBI1622769.1 FAD-binding oxidoreductase [Aquamicrobium zhengzhouense]